MKGCLGSLVALVLVAFLLNAMLQTAPGSAVGDAVLWAMRFGQPAESPSGVSLLRYPECKENYPMELGYRKEIQQERLACVQRLEEQADRREQGVIK